MAGARGKTKDDVVVWAFSDEVPPGAIRIDDPTTLRVLYHPLRSAIMRELGQPRSIKDVAGRLRQPVARLYHHVRLLEEHGLVRVVAERKAGSNTERLYQVAARQIRIGAGLSDLVEASAPGDVQAIVDAAANRFTAAVAELLASGGVKDEVHPVLIEAVRPISHAQARRLQQRISAAITSVLGPNVPVAEDDPRPRYGVTVLMTPFPEGAPDRWVEMRSQEVEGPVNKR